MTYIITIVVDNNTFSDGALIYEITWSGESSLVNNFGSIIETDTIELGTGSFNSGFDIVHMDNLKIYFLEINTDQNANQGKTVAMHVGIEAEESYASYSSIVC